MSYQRGKKPAINNDEDSDEDQLSPSPGDNSLKAKLLSKGKSSAVSSENKINKSNSASKNGEDEFDTDSNLSQTTFDDNSKLSEEQAMIGGDRKSLINRKGFTKVVMHLKLLLLKNYWLFRRNLKITLIQILAPVFFCLLIMFFQYKSSQWAGQEVYHPPQRPINHMPRCSGPDCVSVGYSIIADPNTPYDDYSYIADIMKNFAVDNGFDYNNDVKLMTIGTPQTFIDYVNTNANKTWYTVVWCTTQWPVKGDFAIPCKFQNYHQKKYHGQGPQKFMLYALYYNYTLEGDTFLSSLNFPSPVDHDLLRIKLSIDNSIMKYLGEQKKMDAADIPKIEMSHSSYPIIANRIIQDMNLVAQLGGYFFVLGPLLSFTIFLNEVVREKELKLRQGLQVVGVNHTVYWLSWIITGITFCVITSISLIVSAMICGFDIFWNTPFLISFTIFFVFGLAMVSLAFCVSTLVSTQAQANQVAYTFVLVILIFQIMFSSSDVNHVFLYNNRTMNEFNVKLLRRIFYLIPSFTVSICYGSVANIAATHLDPSAVSWTQGVKYKWSDFFTEDTGVIIGGIYWTVPSPFELVSILFYDALIFMLFTWYFDHIVAHNRGVADSPLFFLSKKYWLSWKKIGESVVNDIRGGETEAAKKEKQDKKKKRRGSKDLIEDYQEGGDQDEGPQSQYLRQKESIKKEKKKVKTAEKEGVECDGLRVVGIKKTYYAKAFGIKSDKDVHAVRGIYLEVPDKELLCLLGHNGAGKSTLFSMLTGVANPTDGTAKIFGFDISTQIDQIRQIMGVVPQFDILWGELTAAEHMMIFSMIKGIDPEDIDKTTDDLLKSVGLIQVKHARVMNFSGGMKRRLSVAISSIGDPRIIFLDEPTTGMDPVSRRDVWNLIQKLKRNKIIILTTHAMEEADVLADRLAVVCDGKLKCVGTPLYLKNTFGDGYRVSLVCEPGNEKEIMGLMSKISPTSKLVDESGGSMVFAVPLTKSKEIGSLFSLIEETEHSGESEGPTFQSNELRRLKTLLKDIGISHTTLEEVFMKVTGKKVSKYVVTALDKVEDEPAQ